MLIAGCHPSALQHIAERIRVAIEGRPIVVAESERTLSVTIGVVSTIPHLDALDPRAFLRFASSALDRARESADRLVIEG